MQQPPSEKDVGTWGSDALGMTGAPPPAAQLLTEDGGLGRTGEGEDVSFAAQRPAAAAAELQRGPPSPGEWLAEVP